MENHFNCIYLYTNKVNDKKYVGQAKDFLIRHKKHIYSAYNEKQKYDYNVPFHNAIRRHGIENFEIEILKENLQNQEELNYWECYYIQEFDTLAKNQKGYNLASGGSNGNALLGKTDEELAEFSRKMSEAMKNRTDEELAEFSRKWHETWNNKSEEEKAEISRKWHETMNNKSEEEKAEKSRKWHETWKNKSDEEMKEFSRKQSETHKGKYKGKPNKNSKLIVRYDLDMNLIDVKYQFEYVEMGFHSSHISDCCRGKRKSTGGFIFKYHEE